MDDQEKSPKAVAGFDARFCTRAKLALQSIHLCVRACRIVQGANVMPLFRPIQLMKLIISASFKRLIIATDIVFPSQTQGQRKLLDRNDAGFVMSVPHIPLIVTWIVSPQPKPKASPELARCFPNVDEIPMKQA